MSKGGKVPAASAGATMMSKFLSKTVTETDLEHGRRTSELINLEAEQWYHFQHFEKDTITQNC